MSWIGINETHSDDLQKYQDIFCQESFASYQVHNKVLLEYNVQLWWIQIKEMMLASKKVADSRHEITRDPVI